MHLINRLIFCLLVVIPAGAQEVQIIPQPVTVSQLSTTEFFTISPSTRIILEGSNMGNSVNFFNNYLKQFYGYSLVVSKNSSSSNALRLNFERLDNELPGAYHLTVDKKGIYITGDNEEGVFNGIQTLIQLLPLPANKQSVSIPHVSIIDAPRFEYRGMHLDVSRHFFPVAFIKKYIDYLALHKLNTFHWHLTEDQGWRIEIKKYPKLTSIGGWRNGTIIGRYPGTGNDNIRYGGYYTQKEIKEVVEYAKQRYIQVIPEIEMPGHSSAAIASYPFLSCFPQKPTSIPANMISAKSSADQKNGKIKLVQETWGVFDDVFCAGNDSTFLFLQNVIDEVIPLFPSKYFHIGGDECPKTHWKQCPRCQKRMKDHNLKDEHELQSYFVQRIEKYLNSKGKTMIGWDEILEGGLAPNAIVMSWQGEKGGIEAAKQNHDVIMTPGNPVYFDHTQSDREDSVTIGGYNPLEKVYAYEPIPAELNAEQGKHVLGAQANVWTEYMKNTKKVEYMIFPRMAALSEVLWSPKQSRDWSGFQKRLMMQFKRYDQWKVNYSGAYFALNTTILPSADHHSVVWKLESNKKDAGIRWFKKLDEKDPPNPPAFYSYTVPIPVSRSGEYSAWTVENGKRMDNTLTQKFSFNLATGKVILLQVEASDKYPGDGAFTLVNGVINEKGFARSKEFLGWTGKNCEAIIDLGSEKEISMVVVNALKRRSSWIWEPSGVEVLGSSDGVTWSPLGGSQNITSFNGEKVTISVGFRKTFTRHVKVIVKNWGTIPEGNPGAGSKAWLFVDEIEVK